MALKLGEILIGRGVVTRAQLDQGLAMQRQFGGRLGTNLVELGFVTEDQLALCLSEQLRLPFIRAEAVAAIPPEVLAFVKRDVAEKYRVIPIRVDGMELHVALADPNNLQSLDDISFALGCRIKAHVITEVTLNYALERYYQIRREGRLAHKPPDVSPAPASLDDSTPGTRSGLWKVPTLSRPETIEELVESLSQVMSEVQVVDVAARLLGHFFEEVLILGVNGVQLAGATASGRSGLRRDVTTVQLTLHQSPLLAEVMAKPHIAHRPQVNDYGLVRACTAAGIPSQLLTAIPLAERSRIPFIALGQGADGARLKGQADALRHCVSRIGCALQIVALRHEIRAPGSWSGGWVG